MGRGVSRDPETEACQEKTKGKNRKSGEKQISTSERVDRVDSGQGEDEIYGSELSKSMLETMCGKVDQDDCLLREKL